VRDAFDIIADTETPVSAFLKLAPLNPRYLLESVESGLQVGRYSFIGLGDCVELSLTTDALTVDGVQREAPTDRDALLAMLREALAAAPRPKPQPEGLPFHGGLVGSASYDLVRYFERLPTHTQDVHGEPLAAFVATRSVLVFDHLTRRVALLHEGTEGERRALRDEVVARLRSALPDRPGPGRFETGRQSMSRPAFLDGVERVKQYIRAGDVFQLVLSISFGGECELDPFTTYRTLRLINPSPYMYYCDVGGMQIVGSSPEALVRLHRGQAWLRPIAGTRPRGATAAQDEALKQELLADEKENAEHVMLVDLARNDLGRVAAPGSISVDPYRDIEHYSHVMHMVSGVRGHLEPHRDAFDLFAAAFPAGTLVGAPKVRAMEIIDELEPARRGVYGGTVGYFGANGAMDQAIAIRTLVFRDGKYRYQAGAGVVADSLPHREYDEVLAKGAALERALLMASEGLD
jgi:anthranilate synthase component 1